jgi:hypothetical protein
MRISTFRGAVADAEHDLLLSAQQLATARSASRRSVRNSVPDRPPELFSAVRDRAGERAFDVAEQPLEQVPDRAG